LFWLMVPASRVAKDLEVNRKTFFTHYTQLKNLSAEASTKSSNQFSGQIEVNEAYFGGVRKEKEAEVMAVKSRYLNF
jgi:hypothetical protein